MGERGKGKSLSLKGCQIVAGGRSVARTTGRQEKRGQHPGRVLEAARGGRQGSEKCL